MLRVCALTVFVICFLLHGITTQSCDPCFIQAPTSRRSCGNHGVDTCAAQDCCYKKAKKIPWCYLPEVDDPCNVIPSLRVPCSENNKNACANADCCWDGADQVVQRRCYVKKDISGSTLPAGPITGLACGIPTEFRHNCGWKGVSKEQCQCRGCCFDNSTRKAIWCFYPGVTE